MTLSQLRIKTPSSRGPGIQFALEVIVNASSMELLLEAIYKEGALRRYCSAEDGQKIYWRRRRFVTSLVPVHA